MDIEKAIDILNDPEADMVYTVEEIDLACLVAIEALQLQAKIQNAISEIDRKHDNYDVMLIKEVKDILNELVID